MNTAWLWTIIVLTCLFVWCIGFAAGYALRRWAEPGRERGLALAVRLLNQDIPNEEQAAYFTEEMLIELAKK